MNLLRRTLGTASAALAALAVVAFTLGTWNPWRLVVLTRYVSNPAFGLAVVALLALAAVWLLLPVKSEAAQHRRVWARFLLVAASVLGLACWGTVGRLFATPPGTVIATSPAGDRAVVLFEFDADDRRLHVWVGRGLLRRDLGDLGKACGDVAARFVEPDTVEVDSSYGAWRAKLDPATGEPAGPSRESCVDPG